MTPRRVAALLTKWREEADQHLDVSSSVRNHYAARRLRQCADELEAALHADPELNQYGVLGDTDEGPPRQIADPEDAARPAASAVPPWLPIETVPEDAGFIIAAWRVHDVVDGEITDVGEAWRDPGCSWFGAYGNDCVEPTHWMPLPDPPLAAEAAVPRPIADSEHDAFIATTLALRAARKLEQAEQQIATLTAERDQLIAVRDNIAEQFTKEIRRRLALDDRFAALQAALGKYLDQHCAQADAEGMSSLCECAICREARALSTAQPAPIVDDLHVELARQANALAKEKNGPR